MIAGGILRSDAGNGTGDAIVWHESFEYLDLDLVSKGWTVGEGPGGDNATLPIE